MNSETNPSENLKSKIRQYQDFQAEENGVLTEEIPVQVAQQLLEESIIEVAAWYESVNRYN